MAKGIAWAFATPPLMAVDEPQHYLYGRAIAKEGHLWVPTTVDVPLELVALNDLLHASQLRFTRHGVELPWTLPDSDPRSVKNRLLHLNQPELKTQTKFDATFQLVTQRAFNSYHPPLYYGMLALIQDWFKNRTIVERLWICRMLSVFFAALTVFVTHRAGLVIFKGDGLEALFLTALVTFHPQFTFATASISNSSLEILIFSSVISLCVSAIRTGLTRAHLVLLIVLLLIGTATKSSMICEIPLLWLLAIRELRLGAKESRLDILKNTAVPVLIASCLSLAIFARSIQSAGIGLSNYFPRTAGAMAHVTATPLTGCAELDNCAHAFATYWAKFGWLDVVLPIYIYALIALVCSMAAALSARWLWQVWLPDRRHAFKEELFLPLFLLLAGALPVLFYMSIHYYCVISTGGWFGVRGQYYLPAIITHMAWLVAVTGLIGNRNLRATTKISLFVGMIVLNLTSFECTLSRFFGNVPFLTQLQHAALLQQIHPLLYIVITFMYVSASIALAIALTRLCLKSTQALQIEPLIE
ncbi:MAG TPA: hypothetical protein V6C72_07760, partial [Chroococcales cyanobacterium]